MPETITLPKLGFDMEEGTFLNWLKNVGDTINKGDVIAEIESDKATIEVEATVGGVLLQTLVQAGQVVPVGTPIAVVGEASAANGSAAPAAAPTPAAVPQVAAPVAANGNGKIATALPVNAETLGEEFPGGVKASPIARKIAEERGIDLRNVHGSGPSGRITKSDVEAYNPLAPTPAPEQHVPTVSTAAVQVPTSAPVPIAAPVHHLPSGPGISVEPTSKLRQRIASRMIESKQTVPHFYVTMEIDMKAALDMRSKVINTSLPENQKVTVNDLIVKAVALTLRDFPNLNSHYYGDKIVRYQYINIGIAVSLEGGGLLNVVAKDADKISISQIAKHNRDMIANARAGKVKPEDIEGSTFTVSNLGAYEVENFAAIINPPEAAILAVGAAKEVPVVINGEIKIGTRMKCTLSVDHRVSDGAEGAEFMRAFKKLLENPMRLLL